MLNTDRDNFRSPREIGLNTFEPCQTDVQREFVICTGTRTAWVV